MDMQTGKRTPQSFNLEPQDVESIKKAFEARDRSPLELVGAGIGDGNGGIGACCSSCSGHG